MDVNLFILCKNAEYGNIRVQEYIQEREMPLILRVMPQLKCSYGTAVVIVCLCV